MADMRIFETVAAKTSLNLGNYNAHYGPWNNMHCVLRCVSEVQVREKLLIKYRQ